MIEHLDSLSTEQKVGQLFFIGIPGSEIDDPTRELLNEISPGGVCLFSRNIREAEQTRELLDDIRTTLPVIPFLSIDQEGGLVDRLRRLITPMPAASRLAKASDAGELALIIAETLRILGFNMNFAPVVDVIDDERARFSNGLFSRTFGSSKEDVTSFAGEFLRGLSENRVAGCLKHFPGLAAARIDAHEELPVVDITEDELSATDLFPYRQLLSAANVPAIMTAHASYPHHRLQETDQNGKLLPSSLSYNFVTTLLRGELAFDGLVITDDLEMGAIIKNYGIGDACTMAVKAGADMLAICADPDAIRAGYKAVLKSVKDGEIEMTRIAASLERIARVKGHLSEPLAFDRDRLTQLSGKVAELNDQLNR